MIGMDVRSNIAQVARQFDADTKQIATATLRALNRALDKAATESSREIRAVYNVRDRAVKAALRKARAHRGNLRAVMTLEGLRIPLSEFAPHWRPGQKVGVTVKIRVDSGRIVIPGSFMAKGKVYKRIGKTRMPIQILQTTSIPQMFNQKRVLTNVNRHAYDMFLRTLDQQLRYLTGPD